MNLFPTGRRETGIRGLPGEQHKRREHGARDSGSFFLNVGLRKLEISFFFQVRLGEISHKTLVFDMTIPVQLCVDETALSLSPVF